MSELDYDCFGLTDRGLKRDRNEDQFVVADLTKAIAIQHSSIKLSERRWLTQQTQARLLLVADGMGGMGQGDRASRMVVNTFLRYAVTTLDWLDPQRPLAEGELIEDLLDAVASCKRRLERHADKQPGSSMGTTLTCAYLVDGSLYVVHVGDSRCYLLRGGELRQVTTDHTVAEQLRQEGALTDSQAKISRWSHVLWQALDSKERGESEFAPQAKRIPLEPGDQVLLCSDGLTKHVPDEDLVRLLSESESAEACCRAMRDAALADGGTDNVTVVVARVSE